MREVYGGARAIVFPVRSVARARRFWVDRMGFSLLREETGRMAMVNLGSLRLRLEASAVSRSGATGASVVFKTRSLARTAKELDERGIAYEQHTGPRDGDWLEVGDPDGNLVLFVERI